MNLQNHNKSGLTPYSSNTGHMDQTKKALADAIISRFEINNNVIQKLDRLYKDGILYENPDGKRYIVMNFRRLGVIANIGDCKIPFYQSRFGTEGKKAGKWYPFFGNAGSWLVKGTTQESQTGYNIPEIKKMMDYLHKELVDNVYDSILTSQEKERFGNIIERRNLAKVQEKNPNTYKHFMFSHIQIRDYLADLLGYNKNETPGESVGAKSFVDTLINSLRHQLSHTNSNQK